MKAKELIDLADYLETVPEADFDMSSWQDEERECGFAGCAIGWAAHGKVVKGLTLRAGQPKFSLGVGRDFSDWTAVEVAFGLRESDAWVLFGPHNRVTPRQQAKRIRDFVSANCPSNKEPTV